MLNNHDASTARVYSIYGMLNVNEIHTMWQVNFEAEIFLNRIVIMSCRYIFEDYSHPNILAGKVSRSSMSNQILKIM